VREVALEIVVEGNLSSLYRANIRFKRPPIKALREASERFIVNKFISKFVPFFSRISTNTLQYIT
jgi:hypothetical protein